MRLRAAREAAERATLRNPIRGFDEVKLDYALSVLRADGAADVRHDALGLLAAYDEETGKLTFETPQVGEFIITAFEFDGEEFSPDFYDELEKTDEVKQFIKYLKEKKNDAGL